MDISKTPLEHLAEQNEKIIRYQALIKELGEALGQSKSLIKSLYRSHPKSHRRETEVYEQTKKIAIALSHIPEELR